MAFSMYGSQLKTGSKMETLFDFDNSLVFKIYNLLRYAKRN